MEPIASAFVPSTPSFIRLSRPGQKATRPRFVCAIPTPGVDRVLIKVTKAPSETLGGLLLSDSVNKKSAYGEVVAVGPGKVLRNGEEEKHTEISVGDNVIFDELANWRVQWEQEDYVVARYRNICAKW